MQFRFRWLMACLLLIGLITSDSVPVYGQCFGVSNAPSPSFSPSAGGFPNDLGTADFNGDGLTDLAIVGAGSGTILIRMGTGNGGFSPATFYKVGEGVMEMIVGDFNADGKPDIAAKDAVNPKIVVFLNQGDGSLSTPQPYPINAPAYGLAGMAAGDLNGDGKPELLVAVGVNETSTGSLAVLENTGNGTFTTSTLSVGDGPIIPKVADLNGDGKSDLAVVTYTEAAQKVVVLMGTGTGTFTPSASYALNGLPASIEIADFNGDGKPDLAVTDRQIGENPKGQVEVFLNTGSGNMGTSAIFTIGNLPWRSTIADLNADGRPDLVASTSTSPFEGDLAVLLNNGAGGFNAPVSYPAGRTPIGITAGDFNNDGKPDLASGDYNGNKVVILLNSGNGLFSSPPAGNTPFWLASADLNGDGKPDLATANITANSVSVQFGTDNGNFGPATTYPVASVPNTVAAGDLNGDGKPDLVLTSETTNAVSILLNSGQGTFPSATTLAVGVIPSSLAIGDITGDGKADVAVTSFSDSLLTIYPGTGSGTFGTSLTLTVGQQPQSVDLGDFNGDGLLDIAVANANSFSFSGQVSVILSTGNGTFAKPVSYETGPASVALISSDLNGDGKPDLAVVNLLGTVSILLNTGNGSFAPARNIDVNSRPFALAAGDLNGDGLMDLAVTNQFGNAVSVLQNTGAGTFAPPVDFATGESPTAVVIQDVNKDGRADIIVSNSGSDNLTLLLNTGIKFATQPSGGYSVNPGSAVPITVRVTGPANGYQWYKDGQIVAGQTEPTLLLRNIQPGDAGRYWVTVVSSCGSLTSTAFNLSVNTGSTGTPLTFLPPVYNCATGEITFNTTGGNGGEITFVAPGVQRSSLSNPTGMVEAELRADPKPLTITATQGGYTIHTTFNFAASCTSDTVPTQPVTDTTHCGSPAHTLGQPLRIIGVTDVNCSTGSFRILTEGGNGWPIDYSNIIGLNNQNPTSCLRFLDSQGLLADVTNPGSDKGNFTLRVSQNGVMSGSFSFNMKQYCTGAARLAIDEFAGLEVTVLDNPVSTDRVKVSIRGVGQQPVTVQVASAAGATLSGQTIEPSPNRPGDAIQTWVRLGSSAGIYVLRVSTLNQRKTVKVLKL
ncbi:FG-GAP-like repeat-containing protein [Larkinella arboricola]|uniref:FG-GAP-like repeat-containing protein n=1 Tax=Larkinella arboricola TaxID=643671 RepID=UPI001474AE68|nr:FG-GAP-like repeat-containing protein [Larkinella arboricola]